MTFVCLRLMGAMNCPGVSGDLGMPSATPPAMLQQGDW